MGKVSKNFLMALSCLHVRPLREKPSVLAQTTRSLLRTAVVGCIHLSVHLNSLFKIQALILHTPTPNFHETSYEKHAIQGQS